MLKSYDTQYERNYQNEIEAYSSFANAKSSENILGCLGSYHVQPLVPGSGLQYTIMLEYAERGSLLQLYEENDPPSSFAETKAFWSSLLQVATALVVAHNAAPTKQGASWYVLPLLLLVCDLLTRLALQCSPRPQTVEHLRFRS